MTDWRTVVGGVVSAGLSVAVVVSIVGFAHVRPPEDMRSTVGVGVLTAPDRPDVTLAVAAPGLAPLARTAGSDAVTTTSVQLVGVLAPPGQVSLPVTVGLSAPVTEPSVLPPAQPPGTFATTSPPPSTTVVPSTTTASPSTTVAPATTSTTARPATTTTSAAPVTTVPPSTTSSTTTTVAPASTTTTTTAAATTVPPPLVTLPPPATSTPAGVPGVVVPAL